MLGRVFEAASVMLLRPARQAASATTAHVYDYEMLMVGRPVSAPSFAERVVFPGGKVENADTQLKRIDLRGGKPFSNRYQVCAIRELFEETGVLFTDPQVSLTSEESLHWRRRVLTEASSFNDMMEAFQCQACVSKLKPWSHWVTPATGEHRFDTWFFVAQASDDVQASVFPGEMELTDISWRSPGVTLEAYRERQLQLAPPQIYILEQMSALPTMDDVFKNLPRPQDIKEYLPIIRKTGEETYTILLPGDKDYTDQPKDTSRGLHRVEVNSDPTKTKVYGADTRSNT